MTLKEHCHQRMFLCYIHRELLLSSTNADYDISTVLTSYAQDINNMSLSESSKDLLSHIWPSGICSVRSIVRLLVWPHWANFYKPFSRVLSPQCSWVTTFITLCDQLDLCHTVGSCLQTGNKSQKEDTDLAEFKTTSRRE